LVATIDQVKSWGPKIIDGSLASFYYKIERFDVI
jgi:hypothetical protein